MQPVEIKIHPHGDGGIAEIVADNIVINNSQDALDLMMNCYYNGQSALIIHDQNIVPAFFDLTTGIAGDILQKFSNYKMRLAIIGDFPKYPGDSLKDFIKESNKAGRINFVSTLDEAISKLVIEH